MRTRIIGPITRQIITGGTPQFVLPSSLLGGEITNPPSASDQGLGTAEPLYVDPTGPPGLTANSTTVALAPGDSYDVIPGSSLPVWINAASTGHRFQAYGEVFATTPLTPIPATFPPSGPVTMTALINSYLYKEYDDDDDLQAFVASYNALGQTFLNTINALNLPIYTQLSGSLLDWVGAGIYGLPRPALSWGTFQRIGPLNTYEFNTLEMNQVKLLKPGNPIIVTDDIYQRILTWAFLKGDGKIFDVRWLKRRVMRFILGTNGINFNVDQTYQISVTFGPNNEVTIRFINFITMIVRGAILNTFRMNTTQMNQLIVNIVPLVPLPNRQVFKAAIESGVLELPFQFTYDIEGAD